MPGSAMSILYETDAVVVALSALVGLLALLALRARLRRLPLPPGPPRWPLVGAAFSVPKEREWLTYERWSREYDSDVVYYESWGRPFVVLNSQKAAVDLLEKKSALYADRPRMRMLTDLCGWGWDLAFMPYAEPWKLARKLFTQHFRASASLTYRPAAADCARALLLDFLRDPDGLFEHSRLTFGKLIMRVTYGIDVRSPRDAYITNAAHALAALNATGNVGTYLVDFVPLLKYVPAWLPGAQWKRDAAAWRAATLRMAHAPYKAVQTAMTEGTARPSVLRALLEEHAGNLTLEVEAAIVSAAGTAYEAASETTWSATLSVLLAALLHPQIQQKAQAELDAVVGRHRLPSFADAPNLPYITAVCTEALRWRPGLPLAVMHRVSAQDVYRGWAIPAGATVVLNSWAILHDPATYADPETFDPDRYARGEPAPAAAFGFGRRACAGSALAKDALFAAVVSLLWAFEVRRAKDEIGREVEVEGEYTVGVVCFPTPFKCELKPREGVREVLLADVEDGRAE